MQENRTKELGTRPIGSLLVKYAVPAVIAMTATSLYNIIDRVFIGRIPDVGTLSLSGLAVTFPIINLGAAFGAMVGVGAATMISIKLGQKDQKSAERVLGNLVTLNIIIGTLVGLLGLAFIDPLLIFFGASDNTISYARDYMTIILWGNVINHSYLGLNSALRSTGHPYGAMSATVVGVTVNAILDPIFIFYLGLGIKGAAYATVLAQALTLIYVIFVMSNPKDIIHLHRGIYGLRKQIVKNILSIGMSPFCMQLCACLVVILINKGLTKHGGDIAIAAYGIVNSIDGYDEISLTGDFKVTTNCYERIFNPSDLGFGITKPEELRAGADEKEAKEIFDNVLANTALPAQKNVVLANAAFGIQVLEKGKKDIAECVEIARESIDSGKALATFKKFVELNS